MINSHTIQSKSTEPVPALSRGWKVASYPERNLGNPSIELFYDALDGYGVRLVGPLVVNNSWLKDNADDVNVAYFHWPERIWRGRLSGRLERLWRTVSLRQIRSVLRLKRFMATAQRLGIRRIWTVHNLEHHEGASWIDRWGYRTLANGCDLLVVYSESGAQAVRGKYPRSHRVLAMRRGNYASTYPVPRPVDEVRRRLGLRTDVPVVSCVGILRKYKGVEVACDAVAQLHDRVQLVVAGQVHSSLDVAELRNKIDGLSRGVLLDHRLTDQEFADVIAASDCVLLPYRKITGSALLHAAWSMGRGIVASDLPFFEEMLADAPDAGDLFRGGDAADLAAAIERYLAIPRDSRREAAQRTSAQYAWERCVIPLVSVLHEWEAEVGGRAETTTGESVSI